MSLHQLYQDTIKQHNRSPIGRDVKINTTHNCDGYNPSCGDELTIYCQLGKSRIVAIGFTGDACAICIASASLLCQHSQGSCLQQIKMDIDNFCLALPKAESLPTEKLKCLSAVSQYPSRINCALLPWQTLAQALNTPITPSPIKKAPLEKTLS